MTDAPIRAALREAGEAARQAIIRPGCCMEGTGCEVLPCHCSQVAASAAIAAFLRALPERFPMPGEHNPDCQVWGHAKGEMRKLAAAVEAAAAEGEGAG